MCELISDVLGLREEGVVRPHSCLGGHPMVLLSSLYLSPSLNPHYFSFSTLWVILCKKSPR